MKAKSYSKFIKYANLNEISKFCNFRNLNLLSNIKSISIWFSIDFSNERSRLTYYSKILLSSFLIYLITNKCPHVQSSKDKNIVHIQSSLLCSDLHKFLEKLLIIYNSQQKKNMMRNFKTKKNMIRFLVTDFNLFTELDNCIQLFGPIKWLCIDVSFTHNEDYRNITLLNNLFKSSYIV
jgi:hypothetical protein